MTLKNDLKKMFVKYNENTGVNPDVMEINTTTYKSMNEIDQKSIPFMGMVVKLNEAIEDHIVLFYNNGKRL